MIKSYAYKFKKKHNELDDKVEKLYKKVGLLMMRKELLI